MFLHVDESGEGRIRVKRRPNVRADMIEIKAMLFQLKE